MTLNRQSERSWVKTGQNADSVASHIPDSSSNDLRPTFNLSYDRLYLSPGASIPTKPMMHFSPYLTFRHCFQKISVWKNFPHFWKFFPTFQKNSHFNRQNFWWPFLVIRSDFLTSPIFAKTLHFPCFGKFIIPLCFANFFPWFRWIYLFLTCFMCFSFPLLWPWCVIQCTY